jgi:hypothetical protein
MNTYEANRVKESAIWYQATAKVEAGEKTWEVVYTFRATGKSITFKTVSDFARFTNSF